MEVTLDLSEMSKKRMELAALLRERMTSLTDNTDILTGEYEPKITLNFGSSKQDYDLVLDLLDALIGDGLYFHNEHNKIKRKISENHT